MNGTMTSINENGKKRTKGRDYYSSDSDLASSETSSLEPRRRSGLDKNSDEYKKRRERNNEAVKKSRNKSKIKTLQTMERVNQLKAENDNLQQKIDILSKELKLLKDIFVAHSKHAHGQEVNEIDLRNLTNSKTIETHLDVSQNALYVNVKMDRESD